MHCLFNILNKMKIIERTSYKNRIQKLIGKGEIIVLTGQRRVGKTMLLRSLSNKEDYNVIEIDKEKIEFDFITDYKTLYQYIIENRSKDRKNLILIDEIQDIDNFEKALRSLYDDDNIDIIVTGSNAKMLSAEISTTLSGRKEEIHIGSLCYNEFLEFHKLTDNQEALLKYLQFGGMPHLHVLGLEEEEMIWNYLREVKNTVILKDVVERGDIRNVGILERILCFVSDSIGKQISANSMVKFFKSQNIPVSVATILTDLQLLEEAYVINKIQAYDIRGRQLLDTGGRYYFEDLGLRNVLLGRKRERDIEKVMENAVYLHLRHIGFDVYYGQLQKGEIDFVCESMNGRIYVQVTYLLASDETREREFGNLQLIGDNYPKYVVSMDPILSTYDYQGIKHINIAKFLQMDLVDMF